MRVRVSRLTIETIRAMWAQPWWTAAALFSAVLVGLVCGWTVVVDARAIDARAERLASQGWGLITVTSASGGLLDPKACDAIEHVAAVQQVGAVGPTRDVPALGLQAGVGLTPVTADAIDIIWPGTKDTAASWLTPGFVALTGWGDGALTIVEDGTPATFRASAIAGPGRYPALDGGVLVVKGELTEASFCVAEVQGSGAEQTALDIAASAVSYGVVAVPAVSADEADPTPQQMVDEHRSRHIPLLSVAFLAITGALRLVRSRRDRAVYRLLAFGRADLWLMGTLEFTICLAAPAMSAFCAVVAWAEASGTNTQTLGSRDLSSLSVAIVVVTFGYASLWASGRNRHQFAPGA